MTTGNGIALAGFLGAFVWGASISEPIGFSVVLFGVIGAFMAWAMR